MDLKVQKRLAAQVMGCSPKRVRFDTQSLPKIKEAITKADIASLAKQGTITMIPARGVSRVRARHRIAQKRKGRLQGHGARKGKAGSRRSRKDRWMGHIRTQRRVLRAFKEEGKLDNVRYRELYLKAKGGFFRSRAHLLLYLEENKLLGGKP